MWGMISQRTGSMDSGDEAMKCYRLTETQSLQVYQKLSRI